MRTPRRVVGCPEKQRVPMKTTQIMAMAALIIVGALARHLAQAQ